MTIRIVLEYRFLGDKIHTADAKKSLFPCVGDPVELLWRGEPTNFIVGRVVTAYTVGPSLRLSSILFYIHLFLRKDT